MLSACFCVPVPCAAHVPDRGTEVDGCEQMPGYGANGGKAFAGGIVQLLARRMQGDDACHLEIMDALNNAPQDAWTIGVFFRRVKPARFIWNMSTFIAMHMLTFTWCFLEHFPGNYKRR